jgi:hypothetical protein
VAKEKREEEERQQRVILRAKAYALAEVASAQLPNDGGFLLPRSLTPRA